MLFFWKYIKKRSPSWCQGQKYRDAIFCLHTALAPYSYFSPVQITGEKVIPAHVEWLTGLQPTQQQSVCTCVYQYNHNPKTVRANCWRRSQSSVKVHHSRVSSKCCHRSNGRISSSGSSAVVHGAVHADGQHQLHQLHGEDKTFHNISSI